MTKKNGNKKKEIKKGIVNWKTNLKILKLVC